MTIDKRNIKKNWKKPIEHEGAIYHGIPWVRVCERKKKRYRKKLNKKKKEEIKQKIITIFFRWWLNQNILPSIYYCVIVQERAKSVLKNQECRALFPSKKL